MEDVATQFWNALGMEDDGPITVDVATANSAAVLSSAVTTQAAGNTSASKSKSRAHRSRGQHINPLGVKQLAAQTGADAPIPPHHHPMAAGNSSDADAENVSYHNNCSDRPTLLLQYIKGKDWKRVLHRCDECPGEAAVWYVEDNADGSVRWRQLPIHQACELNAPRQIIDLVVRAYPNGVQKRDSGGSLPIHLASRERANLDVMEALLHAYPKSARIQDDEGRLPLHLASRKGTSLSVINLLLKMHYRGAQVKDMYSLLPVHWACSQNASLEIVEVLLRAFPPSTRVKDKWGRTPLSLAQGSNSSNKEEVIVALNRDESHWTTSLLDEISILRSQVSAHSNRKQMYKQKVSEIGSQLEEAQATAHLNQEEYKQVREENDRLRGELEERSQECALAKEEKDQIDSKFGKLAEANSELEAKVEELTSKLIAMQRDRDAMEVRLERSLDENGKLREENEANGARLNRLSILTYFMKEDFTQLYDIAERVNQAMGEAVELAPLMEDGDIDEGNEEQDDRNVDFDEEGSSHWRRQAQARPEAERERDAMLEGRQARAKEEGNIM